MTKRIVLDAGHGGHDSGAVGLNKTEEKTINLAVAFDLAHHLTPKYEVLLTRANDTYLSPTERRQFINEHKPDIAISIHCNAAENPQANGFEVITRDLFDQPIARAIYDAYIAEFPAIKPRGILNDIEDLHRRLAILGNLEVPCCLVELGFITNQKDWTLITNTNLVALALYKGILTWDLTNAH